MTKAPDALCGASSARRYLLMQIAVWHRFRASLQAFGKSVVRGSLAALRRHKIEPRYTSCRGKLRRRWGSQLSSLMQIAVPVAFARASKHSERVLYGVPWPPSDVTR